MGMDNSPSDDELPPPSGMSSYGEDFSPLIADKPMTGQTEWKERVQDTLRGLKQLVNLDAGNSIVANVTLFRMCKVLQIEQNYTAHDDKTLSAEFGPDSIGYIFKGSNPERKTKWMNYLNGLNPDALGEPYAQAFLKIGHKRSIFITQSTPINEKTKYAFDQLADILEMNTKPGSSMEVSEKTKLEKLNNVVRLMGNQNKSIASVVLYGTIATLILGGAAYGGAVHYNYLPDAGGYVEWGKNLNTKSASDWLAKTLKESPHEYLRELGRLYYPDADPTWGEWISSIFSGTGGTVEPLMNATTPIVNTATPPIVNTDTTPGASNTGGVS